MENVNGHAAIKKQSLMTSSITSNKYFKFGICWIFHALNSLMELNMVPYFLYNAYSCRVKLQMDANIPASMKQYAMNVAVVMNVAFRLAHVVAPAM
jgi:hypothetical protein